MTEIVFACIVKSVDPLDDDTDPATWRVLGVTAKNLDLIGNINSVSGFYLPDGTQFATVAGERVLYCFHTPNAAATAVERSIARYGEYRGRIAAIERERMALLDERARYVEQGANTDGLTLAAAVDRI